MMEQNSILGCSSNADIEQFRLVCNVTRDMHEPKPNCYSETSTDKKPRTDHKRNQATAPAWKPKQETQKGTCEEATAGDGQSDSSRNRKNFRASYPKTKSSEFAHNWLQLAHQPGAASDHTHRTGPSKTQPGRAAHLGHIREETQTHKKLHSPGGRRQRTTVPVVEHVEPTRQKVTQHIGQQQVRQQQ